MEKGNGLAPMARPRERIAVKGLAGSGSQKTNRFEMGPSHGRCFIDYQRQRDYQRQQA